MRDLGMREVRGDGVDIGNHRWSFWYGGEGVIDPIIRSGQERIRKMVWHSLGEEDEVAMLAILGAADWTFWEEVEYWEAIWKEVWVSEVERKWLRAVELAKKFESSSKILRGFGSVKEKKWGRKGFK